MARPRFFVVISVTILALSGCLANASDADLSDNSFQYDDTVQNYNTVQDDLSSPLIITSSEILEVSLPDNFESLTFENIVIELNQIDITEMVELAEQTLSYQPMVELEVGNHQLVATDSQTGQAVWLWNFEVQYSETSETSLAIDSQFIASQRIAEKNIGDPKPNRFHGQANSQIDFSHTNNRWQVSGAFDLYYDSVEENRFSERPIDNGEFLVSVSNQYAEAHIGHQVVGNGSFVMDNFSRRGVTVGGNIAAIESKISGFSLSSNEIYGFGGGLGISDKQQRVDGVYFESSPITEQPSLLTISGTWVDGEINIEDEYIVQPMINTAGSVSQSWSFSGESYSFDERLHLQAEYARSEFDLDRSDMISAEEDDAHKLAITFSDVTDNQLAWSIGVLKQQVGTFFQSIANQGLATDQSLLQLNSSLQSESLAVQLSTETYQDNVDSIAILPTIETQLNNLMISWSPTLEYSSSWLGAPSFSLGLAEQDQVEIRTPENAMVSVGNEVMSWQASSQFSYETNSWGVNLSNTDFVDRTGFQNDSNTLGVSIFSNLVFAERMTLSASVGMDHIDDPSHSS